MSIVRYWYFFSREEDALFTMGLTHTYSGAAFRVATSMTCERRSFVFSGVYAGYTKTSQAETRLRVRIQGLT
jgi:hypothetical protein